MADEEIGAPATEQLPPGRSNNEHPAPAEPLEPVTSGTTTEGEDELMRQLSASLSTLGIDMKPVGVAVELQEQSLLLPQHPSGECLLPTCPKQGDQAVGVVYDESMKLHIGPAGHPECPERVGQLFQKLVDDKLLERCWTLPPRKATDKELLRAHSAEHIQMVESTFSKAQEGAAGTTLVLNLDTFYGPDTARAARTASGCCIEAVQQVLGGEVSRALAVVRPPGHHAECSRAMGFCFFNNTALAALAALQHPSVQRVAIIDWDIHHGNGIQEVLLRNPSALYISIHRGDAFYPYTSGFLEEVGEGEGQGFNVNIPWGRRGEGDADYLAALELVVEPILSSYQPDLLIVSAGFDAADGDPLGGCFVTPAGYAHMTKRLLQFAGGRMVMALEGGYNTRVTAECAAACVGVLLGGEPARLEGRRATRPLSGTEGSLDKICSFHSTYWPALEAAQYSARWKAWMAAHEAAHARVRRRTTEDYVVYH